MPRRILIIQLARLGDLVQTWPLIKQLRRAHPEAGLSLLIDGAWRDLAGLGPGVDELHTLDLGELSHLAVRQPAEAYARLCHSLKDLRSQDFEVVYNLNFSRVSLLVAHLVGAPVRGYQPAAGGRELWREPWLALVYGLVHARRFNRVHLSDVFRHLAPPASLDPIFPSPPIPAGAPIIALQLATRHPKRTWPLANFARLASLLIGAWGAEIWLLGTAAEQALGERLLTFLPHNFRERVINLQGRTRLGELADRLRQAHLVVSGDTGTLHLAGALGTRVIGIFFGPALCFETGPYGAGQVVIQAEPACHPCTEAGPDCAEPRCLRMITPELVADVVSARLGEQGGHGGPPPEVRIYHSVMDDFGVQYAILAGRPPEWADLVSWCYRKAGARLLGCPSLTAPGPAQLLSGADIQSLEHLRRALRNGATAPYEPAVKEALTPLAAFREVLERQAAWRGGDHPAQVWFHRVKAALGEELAEYAHALRGASGDNYDGMDEKLFHPGTDQSGISEENFRG